MNASAAEPEQIRAAAQREAARAAQFATEAAEKLDAFEAIVKGLEERIDAQYDSAHKQLNDLTQDIENAGNTFASAIQEVTQNVASARQSFAKQSDSLLAEHKTAAAKLGVLTAYVDQAGVDLAEKLKELEDKLAQLDSATQKLTKEVTDESGDLGSEIQEARTQTSAKITALLQAADHLLTQAQSEFASGEARLQEFQGESNQGTVRIAESTRQESSLVDDIVGSAAQSGTQLYGHLGDEARSRFSELAGEANKVMTEYDLRMRDVLGGASNVLALIRQIRPVLDLVRQLA